MMAAIAISGLVKTYGKQNAVDNLTANIAKGRITGFLGPNGAGKSTLLSVMAGTLAPTRGTAIVKGRVLALLGGPDVGLDPEQTGRENALSLGIRLGESPTAMAEKLDDIQEFSGLGKRFDHPVYSYSNGMHVRLRFTAITAIKAEILLVDEGIGAADAEFTARAAERLAQFYGHSGTLVLTSHAQTVLDQHCTSSFRIHEGLVAPSGDLGIAQ